MSVMKIIAGIAVGGLAGYLWHRLVGCPTGGCPITRNPYISTLWGALTGLFFAIGG